ncbi:MAG: trigger factor [Candidatus Dasytiphilus stammeri]
MQVSVEKTNNLGRRIKITIPAEEIKNLVQTKLIHVAQKVRLDGFRQGKVPLKIVSQRYGMSILHEVLTDLMQEKLITIMNQNNLVPVGKVNYIPWEYKEGNDFTYVIEFDIYPEIKLKEFDCIKVKKPMVEVNKQDVDNMLVELCRRQGVWNTVNRPVKFWDRVTIELINLENDEINKIHSLILIIEPKSMDFDLDQKILGHKIGENFIVELNFPDEETNQIITTKFSIVLKKIEECQVPELNEELIKHLGVPETEGSIVKLRDEIRKNMQRELKNTVRHFIKLQIFHGLLMNNKIEVPISLLETELKNSFQPSGIKKLFPHSLLEKQAKNRVTLGLLLNEVIRINKLQVEERRIQSLRKYFRKNNETMKTIHKLVLEDMAVELIMNQCVITEEKIPFQDLRKMIVKYEQYLI